MTKALGVLRGQFGRVALLDMNTSLVPHAHPHCHIILKASGPDQVFTVRDQEFPVRDDTVVLVNTWEPHHYTHREHDQRTLFLALYIEPSWLKSADGHFVQCERPAFFGKSGAFLTSDSRLLRDKVVACIEHHDSMHSKEAEELIFDLTVSIVHQFANWRSSPRQSDPIKDFRIRRVIRKIRDGVAEADNLDELAKCAGLSRPHFNYLFKQQTGVSPGLFCNALRVEESVRVVSEERAPIAAVSERLGFSAQSNFTRFFKQHTGANPNQFRRVVAQVA